MSDRGIPLVIQEAIVEMQANIIDRVKIVDHVGLIARMPADLIVRKIAKYREHGIHTFPGGVPFEVAYLQKQADAYLARVHELGFSGVEISSDCIPPIPVEQRVRLIRSARKLGLEVFTEVGYKVVADRFGKDAMREEDAIEMIRADLDAGASKVAVENNELLGYVRRDDPAPLAKIADAIGLDNLLFEIGGGGTAHPEIAKWLLRHFGADINFENVDPERVVHTEAMRCGLSRAVEFSFFANA